MAERDFILGDDGDMQVRNGDFVAGESLTQEVALIMLTNKGEIRHDPLCGCDLLKMTNARITRARFERLVRVQLERDGKNWSDLKDGINLRTNG